MEEKEKSKKNPELAKVDKALANEAASHKAKQGLDFLTIKSPFKAKQIKTACISIPDKKLLILNIFLPSGKKPSFVEELVDFLKKIKVDHPLHKLTIVWDFNLNLLETDIYTNNLSDNLTHLGFLQYVSKPTRITGCNKTLIDYVYSDIGSKASTYIIMMGISDHEITFTTIHSVVRRKKEEVTKRWLKDYHYTDIAEKLEPQSWESYSKLPFDEMGVVLQITTWWNGSCINNQNYNSYGRGSTNRNKENFL